MSLLRTLRASCPDKIYCPAIRVSSIGDLFVQGYVITDAVLLTELNLPPGETVVRIPAAMAAVLVPDLLTKMDTIDRATMWVSPHGDLFTRGCVVSDEALLAELDLPPSEGIVRIPAAAAGVLLLELSVGSTSP